MEDTQSTDAVAKMQDIFLMRLTMIPPLLGIAAVIASLPTVDPLIKDVSLFVVRHRLYS